MQGFGTGSGKDEEKRAAGQEDPSLKAAPEGGRAAPGNEAAARDQAGAGAADPLPEGQVPGIAQESPKDEVEAGAPDGEAENKAGPSMASFALRIMGRHGAGDGRDAEDLRRGLEEFERGERKRGGEGAENGPARFLHLLRRQGGDDDGAEAPRARSRRAQARAAVACACLLFAAYFAYQKFFGPSEAELSFEDLRSRVPIKIDKYTTISRAELADSSIEITVVKADDAFAGLGDAAREARLEEFGRGAQSLCRNKLFQGIINGGRPLHVSLDSTSGRTLRKYSVNSCPADPAK